MINHYFELSIYIWHGKKNPRLAIMSVDEQGHGGGTRLYGPDFNSVSSIESYEIPLNERLVDEIIKELQIIKSKLGESK